MADSLEILRVLQDIDFLSIAERNVQETIAVIPDLNASQMYAGVRADGSPILPDYTDYTIEMKKLKGQPTDRVTLQDTGAHYRALYAELKGDVLEYGSKDVKSDALQKKYGKIYGLNDDSRDEYVQGFLLPLWQRDINSLTGLKFN